MKILLVANSDWGLYNYRLPIAAALRAQGAEVALVCPEGPYAHRLRDLGYRVLPWNLRRRSLNPVFEALALLHLVHIYRQQSPAAVHHFTIKPNVYGTIAAVLARIDPVFNTWTGLGFIFSGAPLARALRVFLIPLMRRFHRMSRVWTIFQTEHDRQAIIRIGLVNPEYTVVIAGSGVDTTRFTPKEKQSERTPVVLMAARLLHDKGVGELVTAVGLLREWGIGVRTWIAGTSDRGNPNSVTEQDIDRWRQDRGVEFLGHQDDMPALLAKADIAVLPTFYNEGVPFFLLEAAAAGLPSIATDFEGCRSAVRDGVNGLIVPPRDPPALARAIATIVADSALRRRMGVAGREIAVQQFDQHRIIEQFLDVYRRLGLLPAEAGNCIIE